MSGHCPRCGTYHEEDDDRVCAACKSEKKNHYCPECAAKWADEAFAAVRMVKADEIDRLNRENADLRATCQTLAVMAYNSRYLGFDREWVRSQIAGIANERAREMLLALDAKTRGEA